MDSIKFDPNKKMDFIAIGRAAIDLNPNEINRPMEDSITFTKYVGGSPANITVALSVLGMKTGFIGRVANDPLGRFVEKYLRSKNIDTSHIVFDNSGAKTGLAFLEIKSPNDSSITMYRENAVDLKIDIDDIDEEYIKNSKALLISGTALASSPSREAVFTSLEYARKHNTVVFFDLDYRPYTWKSVKETSIYYNLAAEKCDVIIGTREEFDIMETVTLKGNKDDSITANRWFDYNAKIVVIKHGKEGSIAYTKDGKAIKGAVFPVTPLKSFGAGDSYAGAFIYGLMNGLSIEESMKLGAASAAIVVSSHSCSDAMPTIEEIKQFIENYNK